MTTLERLLSVETGVTVTEVTAGDGRPEFSLTQVTADVVAVHRAASGLSGT